MLHNFTSINAYYVRFSLSTENIKFSTVFYSLNLSNPSLSPCQYDNINFAMSNNPTFNQFQKLFQAYKSPKFNNSSQLSSTNNLKLSHYKSSPKMSRDYDQVSMASTYDSSQRQKLIHSPRTNIAVARQKERQLVNQKTNLEESTSKMNENYVGISEMCQKISKGFLISSKEKVMQKKRLQKQLRMSKGSNLHIQTRLKAGSNKQLQQSEQKQCQKTTSKNNFTLNSSSIELASKINPTRRSPEDSLENQINLPMFMQQKIGYTELKRQQFSKNVKFTKKQILSIEDFELGKCCGKGMFGDVYAARLRHNGTLFALKKISKEMVVKNKMQKQLTLEIKIQMFLDHPNILRLYHFFDDREYIYLVMEYMEEGSLFNFIQKRTEKISQKEVAMIILQMSNAVSYLHDVDVIHRDIKPQNIVISNGVRKLCDFGWATVCDKRRNTCCGTFDYAAPQVLQGKGYDNKVDIWCLGVLAYQLRTRKVPFYDVSKKETIRRTINCDKEGPVFPLTMSIKCRHFIESLVKKNPQQRLNAEDLYSHPFLVQFLPK